MPKFDTTDDPIAHDNYPLVSSGSDDARVDSSVVSYTPGVLTDWDGDTDPGNVDAALDQLAERVDDNENALSSLTNDHGELLGLGDDDHTQYLLADGTRGLSADWDAGSHKVKAEQLESDIAAGTAPLIVASDTVVTNLNADKLDGNEASAFAASSHNHNASDINTGILDDARVSVKHRQVAHMWYLEDPQAGDKYVLCKVPVAATIKRVNHIAIGVGSSADFNIDIRAEAMPETGGTEVWNADKTVNTTHSIETTFDNASVSQYQILVVLIEAVGGTVPDRIWIGLVLEYD